MLARIEGRVPDHTVPLDVQGTAFQRRVWEELRRIPLGETRTYGDVAASIGSDSAPGVGVLPDKNASAILSVAPEDNDAMGGLVVFTEAVSVEGTGSEKSGGAIRRRLRLPSGIFRAAPRSADADPFLWNLQETDAHDFAVLDSSGNVLTDLKLQPLEDVAFTFTFHKEGLFNFKCLTHQPVMNGQILVVGP